MANDLYAAEVTKTESVSSLQVVEACKILENNYLGVKIVVVSGFRILFPTMGIDVWGGINSAKTKLFGFQAGSYPGQDFVPLPSIYRSCRKALSYRPSSTNCQRNQRFCAATRGASRCGSTQRFA